MREIAIWSGRDQRPRRQIQKRMHLRDRPINPPPRPHLPPMQNEPLLNIREFDHFSIGVAGFPEGHIACKEGKYVDWGHLKTKIDAGADFVLTQLFFENDDFLPVLELQFVEYTVGCHGAPVALRLWCRIAAGRRQS